MLQGMQQTVTVALSLPRLQPTAPLQLPGVSASIATLAWQCAFKENVLDKVQDEIHQVRFRS